MIEHGQTWQDRGERGWRRVVASPEPLECLEADAAAHAARRRLRRGVRGRRRRPRRARCGRRRSTSVEAVIDKDLTAAVLAPTVAVDVLVIATDVDAAQY